MSKRDVRRMRTVPLRELAVFEACQARVGLVREVVEEYAELYRSKDCSLPPVEAFEVARRLHLIDGFHRYEAAREAGREAIGVRIVGKGTVDECVWRATSSNQGHGLRRTNADKRRAARLALLSEVGQEQSSRVVAEHIGVSPDLVSRVREEIEARQSSPATQVSSDDNSTVEGSSGLKPVAKVAGKDGKRYPRRRRNAKPAHLPPDRVKRARTVASQKCQRLREELGDLWPAELAEVGVEVDQLLEQAKRRCEGTS